MKTQFIGALEWKEYKKKGEGGFRNVFPVPDQSSHSLKIRFIKFVAVV